MVINVKACIINNKSISVDTPQAFVNVIEILMIISLKKYKLFFLILMEF